MVTPTCEAFSEVQMFKAPNGRRPKLNMDTELPNRLSAAFTEMLPGKTGPSVGIISDSMTPWWIAKERRHGILVPIIDCSGLNMAFVQYYISECPIYATVAKHLEMSLRATLHDKFKGLKANPLGITQRRTCKESLIRTTKGWDKPLTGNTLPETISGLKDPSSLLALFKIEYPKCHLNTLAREGYSYLYLRFAGDLYEFPLAKLDEKNRVGAYAEAMCEELELFLPILATKTHTQDHRFRSVAHAFPEVPGLDAGEVHSLRSLGQ